jgi:hypothetical protein
MQTFVDPNLLQRLRVGPLAPYLDAYLKQIEQEGFLPSSAPMQMYAIARFSNWLHGRQLDLHQVDEASVERFLNAILALSIAAKLLLCVALLQCCGRTK